MSGKSVVFAGLAAGLVMNLLDFMTNGLLFGDAWNAAYAALHITPTAAIPAFWISFDFANGVLMAFLYAAMRPRLGAGTRNILTSALISWTFVHLALFSHFADHVFPPRVLLGTAALELISSLVGGVVAGRLYREARSLQTAPGNY